MRGRADLDPAGAPGPGTEVRPSLHSGKLFTVIQVAVTAGLLFLVLRAVDPAKLLEDLRNMDPLHLALLAIFCWIGHLLCVQRWRLFAAALGMPGRYVTLFRMYFLGMFCNIGLPSLVGGDVVKAYLLGRRSGAGMRLGLASVLQDRIVGLLAMLMLGTAVTILHPISWRGIPLLPVYGFIWLGVIGVLWTAWKGEGIYSRFIEPEGRSPLQRLLGLLASFHQALITLHLSKRRTVEVFGYSFINSAIVFWVFQQVSVAAGHPVPLIAFSTLIPLITLVTMLPISLGGIGIREWAYIEALAILGVPRHMALSIALTTSALLIVTDLPGAIFLPMIPAEMREKAGRT